MEKIFKFDGVDDRIEFSTTGSLNTTSWSIALRGRPKTQDLGIWVQSGAFENYVRITPDSNAVIGFDLDTERTIPLSFDPTDGVRTYVFNYTEGVGVELFVDDQYIGVMDVSVPLDFKSTGKLNIGAAYRGAGQTNFYRDSELVYCKIQKADNLLVDINANNYSGTGNTVPQGQGSREGTIYGNPFWGDSGSGSSVLPNVVLGDDLTTDISNTVTLSQAFAENFDSLLWECTSGQTPTFSDTTILNPEVTFNEGGAHTLRLTATNIHGTANDSMNIEVSLASLNPPVSDAGVSKSASEGELVQLDGTASTDNSQIVSYKWKQLNGVLCDISDVTISTPTFTVPQANYKNAYAQDIYAEQNLATPSTANDSVPHALKKILDISYLGAFKIGYSDSTSSSEYSNRTLGISADGTKIYVSSHNYQNAIGEFEIPTLSLTSNLNNLPEAVNIQPYTRVISKNTFDPANNDRINGILDYGGKLFVTSERFYNTEDTSANIQFFSDSGDLENSQNTGLVRLAGSSKSGGWMSKIPQEWQAILGGPVLSGWSANYSINSRYSIGPSLYTFHPDDVALASAGDEVSSVKWMDYSLPNPLAEGANDSQEVVNPLWSVAAQAQYGFIIPNTSYYIAVGSFAGLLGKTGYKIDQDTGQECKGFCGFYNDDFNSYYWIYDLNDIVNAEAPYTPRPFSYGRWQVPFGTVGGNVITGAVFDDTTDRLYLNLDCDGVGPTSPTARDHTIVVYEIKKKSEDITDIGADLTDLVFELTVTDDEGYSSSDITTVSTSSTQLNLPSVDAGQNITATNGDTVTLSTATVSDYNSLLWTCTSGQSPTFSDATELNPTVTFNESGLHTLRLTATNSDGSDFDELTVDVAEVANQPPTANAGTSQSVAAGATVQLDGTGSTDGDGTIVSYTWTQTVGGNLTLTGATPNFTAPISNTAQTLTFELTVTDDGGLTSLPTTVNVEVQAEVVSAIESTLTVKYTGMENKAYTTVVVDVDNNEVLYNQLSVWTDGTHSFTFAGTPVGTNVKVSADDGLEGVLQNEVTQ